MRKKQYNNFMRKLLICDFDGTLINETSELEFIRFLVRERKNKFYHYILSILSNLLNNIPLFIFNKGSWFKAWSAFRSIEEQKSLFEEFSKNIEKNISINNKVLNIVKNFKGEKILLTGCYEPLANHVLNKLNIKYLFNSVIGTKIGYLNYFVRYHPFGKDKVKYIKNNSYVVGIGNSWSDRFFLSACNEAYIISGSKKLEKIATKNKWQLIYSSNVK